MAFFTLQMLFCRIFKKNEAETDFPRLRKYEDEEYAVRQNHEKRLEKSPLNIILILNMSREKQWKYI